MTQYQPAGSEPVVSKPPIAARFRNSTFNSALVGTRQSLCPCSSSFEACFAAWSNVRVSGAPFGVVCIGLPVSGDTPTQIVPSGKPGQPAKLSRAEQIKRDMQEWRRKNDDKDFGREM